MFVQVFPEPDFKVRHDRLEPLAFLTGLLGVPPFDLNPQITFDQENIRTVGASIRHLECLWLPEKVLATCVEPLDERELPAVDAVKLDASLPVFDAIVLSSGTDAFVMDHDVLHWMTVTVTIQRRGLTSINGASYMSRFLIQDVSGVRFKLAVVNVEKACLRESVRVLANESDSSFVNNIESFLETLRRERLFCCSAHATTLGMTTSGNDVAVEGFPVTELNVSKRIATLRAAPIRRDKTHAAFVFDVDSLFRFIERHARPLSKIHGE